MKSRNVTFSGDALNELQVWIKTNPKIARKITELLDECIRSPHIGKGKPEPLKGNYSGYWSRRITDEHRLIYEVSDEHIYVYSCEGHYGDK